MTFENTRVNSLLEQGVTPRSLRAAGALVGMLMLASALVSPWASLRLGEVRPFLPMFATAVFMTESLTAYLLATLAAETKAPFLALLSGAYAFVAVMAAVQVLIFPGVFSDTGLLGAGPQSAVWVWTMWHAGFPLLVLFALLGATPMLVAGRERQWQRAGRRLMIAAPLLALALGYLATADAGARLPPLIDGVSYTSLVQSPAAKLVIGLNLLAIVGCVTVTRLRNLLSLWLAVALLASLADASLTLLASQRYSLGWYAARVLSLVSSSVVLGVLIREISFLYRQLADANRVLSEHVIRDGLTNAFNRRYFIDQGPRDLRLARRQSTPLSLLMIDADHFKAYNDSMGHVLGDQCLIAIVAAIHETIHRPLDYLVRYGGEEFIVVLPNTDAQGAIHMAHAIRAAVAARRLERRDGLSPFVTISIGLATLPAGTEETEIGAIVQRADEALYQAKAAGRDTLRVHGAPTPRAAAHGPR